ncbi:MAG: hypothetical protein HQ559_09415 [Lentisphaerae bacterium]|nr:hypothetical protein [Lentisphaerota bacterium]
MKEADQVRRIGDIVAASFAALGLAIVFWLCKRSDVVNAHRLQAYALFLGPGMILEAMLYLREKKWVLPFRNKATGATTATTLEGSTLKAAVCLLSLTGLLAMIWSVTFWMKVIPQIGGS